MIHSIEDYAQFNIHTNPGRFIEYFHRLPSSIDALCDLIQKQIVHPWDGSPQPIDRKYNPQSNLRVEDLLEKLVKMNPLGLVATRTLNERVIGSCRENAILFTAILNSQGVPSRPRAGWVKYLSSNTQKFTDHWVSEIWQAEEKRWILVDTNPKRIDFSQTEFVSGAEAWLQIRSGQKLPETFRSDDDLFYVKLNFGHDFDTILGLAPPYWEAPPIFHIKMKEIKQWQLALLDQIAALLINPDQNIKTLQRLRTKHALLQGVESAWPIFQRTTYRGLG
ncbi:MAG: transglutaminase-like domain-containing protein [Chloroflexota bacterium]